MTNSAFLLLYGLYENITERARYGSGIGVIQIQDVNLVLPCVLRIELSQKSPNLQETTLHASTQPPVQ